jgi:glycosyltransferase involved in cell wall biosynthesis
MNQSVLNIFSELSPSGGETMLLAAQATFKRRGIVSHVVSTGARLGSYAEDLAQAGVSLHHIPFRKSFQFFKKVYTLIRAYQFSTVHIHTEQAYLFYALAARAAHSRQIVRTVHHIFPWSGLLRLRNIIFRHTCSKLLGCVFLSNSRSGLDNEWRCYRMRNRFIPNWYNSDLYQRRTLADYKNSRALLGITEGSLVAVSVGGNSVYKNLDIVVDAIATLPAKSKIQYLQVGDEGPGQALTKLLRSYSDCSRIKLCGRVPDPLPYLKAADVFVMPSKLEGFGVAAAEAMAVGVPTILSDRPALSDFRHATDQIEYIDCSTDALQRALLRLEEMEFQQRWTQGQSLAEAMPSNYGLGVGPELLADLYQSQS